MRVNKEVKMEKSYQEGYYDGVEETLRRVGKWLDEETIDSLQEELLK